MRSVQDTIIQSIRARKKGAVLFMDAFDKFGSSEAVRQAFSRLQKSEFIIRLAKGIYLYPFDKENLRVSMEQIAREVAARDKAHILPTGIYAQHRLGLSTQVQTNWVYITDGTPRTLNIGGNTIKFKKGVAKNFAYKSEMIYLIVAALREMYDLPNEQINRKLKELLKAERSKLIKHDLALAPKRIRVYLQNLLNDEN
ncbi:MAG: hypothetical protein B6D64_05175 [Bacteroidetes bacterium 4484_276]|nr:MAG: hypothetical protein B6D64_05175 [Bacteroidetes bacterium 4484_276]